MAWLGLSFTKGFFGYTGRTRNPTQVAMDRLGLSFIKGFLGYSGRTRNLTSADGSTWVKFYQMVFGILMSNQEYSYRSPGGKWIDLGWVLPKCFWDAQVEPGIQLIWWKMARLGLSFTKWFLGYSGRIRNPTGKVENGSTWVKFHQRVFAIHRSNQESNGLGGKWPDLG